MALPSPSLCCHRPESHTAAQQIDLSDTSVLNEVRGLVLSLAWLNALLSIVVFEIRLVILFVLLTLHKVKEFHEFDSGICILLTSQALLLLLFAQWNLGLVLRSDIHTVKVDRLSKRIQIGL